VDSERGLEAAFADVEELAAGCRFRDCAHDDEPGCAVRDAVERGVLPAERLAHWRQLARELAYLARRQDQRAAADARGEVRAIHREARRFTRWKYR
jgi:ribosome biogenesis GTPase / thiamine phosphate phosphatase